jgi:hypothetical protein
MTDATPITAENLSGLNRIAHGFFTREGGISQGIYASLNCGLGSRDDATRVLENRSRVARHLGTDEARLVSVYQVHSAHPVTVSSPWDRDQAPKADAMVSATPGLAIGVLTADCAPVLLADDQAGVVAAAHAGWQGALAGVLEETVAQMEALGASRENISAAIGPAISADAYEVGDEFKDKFVATDAANAAYFSIPDGAAKPHFDLPRFVFDRLSGLGLKQVAALNVCTYAEESRLFSYRRTVHRGEGDYGRQISAILLT